MATSDSSVGVFFILNSSSELSLSRSGNSTLSSCPCPLPALLCLLHLTSLPSCAASSDSKTLPSNPILLFQRNEQSDLLCSSVSSTDLGYQLRGARPHPSPRVDLPRPPNPFSQEPSKDKACSSNSGSSREPVSRIFYSLLGHRNSAAPPLRSRGTLCELSSESSLSRVATHQLLQTQSQYPLWIIFLSCEESFPPQVLLFFLLSSRI
jgi:hypothetical protein